MKPTTPGEREPVLDALRGVAILGILPVNMVVMSGSDWLGAVAGAAPPETYGIDAVASFLIGWLATGKFISSLAMLFGFGAGLIAARATINGASPGPVLLRRYGWLALLGLLHMFLLFPGDILFVYGVTGCVLLLFVGRQRSTVIAWALVLFAGFTALGISYWFTPDVDYGDTAADALELLVGEQQAEAFAAYASGRYAEIVGVHLWQAPIIQSGQLFALPWILALFLIGYALASTHILDDPGAWRTPIRRAAIAGLAIGLPLNFALGYFGPLAAFGIPEDAASPAITLWAMLGQQMGQPVLAVGYLAALTLLFTSRGTPQGLAAVGRMALTAYLLESALALALFGGLRLYDRVSVGITLLACAGIWATLLLCCPIWFRFFRFGPVEWLWRSLVYLRAQPILR